MDQIEKNATTLVAEPTLLSFLEKADLKFFTAGIFFHL